MLMMPLGWLVRLWGATLRFEISPESLRNLMKIDEPVAFMLWHNRLFLVPEAFRRYRQGRPIYGLVSASKDGAWLDAFLSLVGIGCVRGSSSRFGREAALALVHTLRAGHDIGITPDGPRGPRYDFKEGGLIVARRAGAPILLFGAAFESAWQLGSWDGFWLPKPFSKVRISCESVARDEQGDRTKSAVELGLRLKAINPDKHERPSAF